MDLGGGDNLALGGGNNLALGGGENLALGGGDNLAWDEDTLMVSFFGNHLCHNCTGVPFDCITITIQMSLDS